MNHNYLAFDLGAESGRAILGQLRSGVLDITEVHRFPNQPVRCAGSLHWDVLRLWHEMQRGLADVPVTKLDSVAVDTWGVDCALIGEDGELMGNPFHYRDHRNDGMVEAVCARVPPIARKRSDIVWPIRNATWCMQWSSTTYW